MNIHPNYTSEVFGYLKIRLDYSLDQIRLLLQF